MGGALLAFFILILGVLAFRLRRRLPELPETSGAELPSHQSAGSQSSTLAQGINPVSSPASYPEAAPSSPTPNLRPHIHSPTLQVPGHNFRSNTTSAPSPLLPTSSSSVSQASVSTVIADPRAQQIDPAYNIQVDARASGSKVVFNLAPRH